MEIGINLATVNWEDNFEGLPTLIERIDADGVEFPIQLWLHKKCNPTTLSSLNVLNVSGILHRTLIFPESIFIEEKKFEENLVQLEQKLEAAKCLKCSAMSLGIDPWSPFPLNVSEKTFVERVTYLAAKLAKYNIVLNLEYISHKIMSSDQKCSHMFCPSLKQAVELIEKIKLDSVKLLLDVIHWFADGMSISPGSLKSVIGLVHLCDHSSPDSISDLDRVLPFEGKLPLSKFLYSLEKEGYSGAATIEVFRRDSYQPDLSQVQRSISSCKA